MESRWMQISWALQKLFSNSCAGRWPLSAQRCKLRNATSWAFSKKNSASFEKECRKYELNSLCRFRDRQARRIKAKYNWGEKKNAELTDFWTRLYPVICFPTSPQTLTWDRGGLGAAAAGARVTTTSQPCCPGALLFKIITGVLRAGCHPGTVPALSRSLSLKYTP